MYNDSIRVTSQRAVAKPVVKLVQICLESTSFAACSALLCELYARAMCFGRARIPLE